jgi:LacI family transcriptional regulator
MALQRVRMIDVANEAGVSRTTASFVLNDKDAAIPLETRTRVLQAAERLGYRPHAGARALATGRTNRIGLVLIDSICFRPGDNYFAGIMAGIMDGAVQNGHDLLLHSARYPDLKSLHLDVMNGSTDGALLVGRSTTDELTQSLLDSGFPVVCISYRVDRDDCWSVDCDNFQGGALAMQHLLSLGHTRVAFFYPHETSWGDARFAGARSALAEAGLPEDYLVPLQWNEETPIEQRYEWIKFAAQFLREEKPRPTAMICSDEARVRAVVEILPQYGIRVPRDLAVVSFNSTEMSARTRPSLTSVWQPLREIGASAVDRLNQLIAGQPPEPRDLLFPMRLDVRSSTITRGRAAVDLSARPLLMVNDPGRDERQLIQVSNTSLQTRGGD